jgi:hypothetical protein
MLVDILRDRYLAATSGAARLSARPDTGASAAIRVFVAMSLREAEEPALVDYWQAMRRAATRSRGNFDLRRIDHVEGDYEIINRIFHEIRTADLMIADLTLSPANVYLELGFARGHNKAVIQTCHENTPLEFDVRGHRTLMYRNATSLEEKLLSYLDALVAAPVS